MSKPLQSAQSLQLTTARIGARLSQLARREADVRSQVELAKAFLAEAPAAQEVLEETQRRVNQQLVGGLSDMLTALLAGVMDDPDRAVVCESEVDGRGTSTVRFCVRRSSGDDEDILSGNGGSIANVVCTGLRLIAVHRARRMRRFLVLDEPDCWLAPERVPALLELLQRTLDAMSDEPMQVVMITHHDVSTADDRINIVDLERTPSGIRVAAQIAQPALPGQIDVVELSNWRSHAHTCVPLGNGLTVIRGANNIGKSAVVEALRCLSYGGARADVVAHGQPEARAALHFVGGGRLELQRKRKGSPALAFRQIDAAGETVREDYMSKGMAVPPWHADVLGISEVDGLQVHVSDQKKPIFLLDEPASRQTAILSIGQEAQEIVAMLERYKDAKREAQAAVRTGEPVLEAFRRLMLEVGDFSAVQTQSDELAAAGLQIEQADALRVKLGNVLTPLRRLAPLADVQAPADAPALAVTDTTAMRRAADQIKRLQPLSGIELTAAVPTLAVTDTAPVRQLAARLAQLAPLSGVQAPAAVTLPTLTDGLAVAGLVERIQQLSSVVSLTMSDPLSVPVVTDTSSLRNVALAINQVTAEGKAARTEVTKNELDTTAAQQQLAEIESELDGCPTCGSICFAGGRSASHQPTHWATH